MKKDYKSILALIGVAVLAGLFISALVLAILGVAFNLLKIIFLLTFAVPVLLYIYTWLFKKTRDRRDNRETGLRQIEQDPDDTTEDKDM